MAVSFRWETGSWKGCFFLLQSIREHNLQVPVRLRFVSVLRTAAGEAKWDRGTAFPHKPFFHL